MEVYKRGDSPFWYCDLVDPSTKKRVRKSTQKATKRDAQVVAREMLAAFEERFRNKDGDRLPVALAEATQEYVDHLVALKKPSAGQAAQLRDKLLGLKESMRGRWRLDGSRDLHELEPVDLERLARARREEGNGPQTIAHEIKFLRATTRYAAGLRRRVPTMLTDGTVRDPWRIPTIKQKTRYLNMDEWQKLYAFLDPARPVEAQSRRGKQFAYERKGAHLTGRQDSQDLLVALTLCGGRTAEITRLTWDRVDTDALKAWIGWSALPDAARGDSERPSVIIRLWGSKTDKERLVGASDQVCVVLARRWAAQEDAHDCPLIFPGRGGKTRKGSIRPILRAIAACGINRPDIVEAHGRATVHSLRHTFASLLIQNGADLAKVKDALGHATLQMTLRYAHLAKRAAAEEMGAILSRAVPAGRAKESGGAGYAASVSA